MKKLVLGILAHVDAGKTTLSEAMLYLGGSLRELGRVDKGNTFFDTHAIERQRGITIFSKQAQLQLGAFDITLLDTPGHVDFSAEMERTLQVLDYAILVINGADGVQAHTRTLWQILNKYELPVFIFINKMDQPGTDKGLLLNQLKVNLSGSCVDFSAVQNEAFYENVAVCQEEALDSFLADGCVPHDHIIRMISQRKIYPCYFGSALKLNGVEEFMRGLAEYSGGKIWASEFGAKVYKISRDNKNNRLTHMKITGGSLKVRTPIKALEEKVNQIRIYSGEKYETVNEVKAGSICAVTGLSNTNAGMLLGGESVMIQPILEPVLTYRILWSGESDHAAMLLKLRQLEEEEPLLHIVWKEEQQEIQAKLMGEVQQEVLADMVKERFGISISFGEGKIAYKETISDTVEGVGHFEPLRHYAEVHLILQPGERGSGLVFETNLSEDELERSWQRLIMTHLKEKEHRGVLTGAPITDMKITLAAGRAHKKHTEGGDFRQATYRALRQGLRLASTLLLEPWYEFRMEIPEQNTGRAMADIEKMAGTFLLPDTENGISVLTGAAPVLTMQSYQKELTSYTKGTGRLYVSLRGYEPCHNAEKIIEEINYNPDRDLENTADSVFCSHGAGVVVNWQQVKGHMHLESKLADSKIIKETLCGAIYSVSKEPEWIGTEEIDKILINASFANTGNKKTSYKKSNAGRERIYDAQVKSSKQLKLEQYLLVDGYNIIFAWKELKELAAENIEGARGKLMDMLCNYRSAINATLIIVFDAYKVENHKTEIFDYYNIHVVYTAYAETADQYIERFAHSNNGKYDITVATSDYMEQIITSGQGCQLLSARELEETVRQTSEKIMNEYAQSQEKGKNYPMDNIHDKIQEKSD